jgi:phosphoribosylaminoimidazole-succinocarboxamide synthase
MSDVPLLSLELPGIPKLKSGKVREVFDLGDRLLFVATDRISAFDCIMPNGIPQKGEVLTQISHFWFDRTESWLPNHRLARAGDALPPELKPFEAQLKGRSMIVCKAAPLPMAFESQVTLGFPGAMRCRCLRRSCGEDLGRGGHE